MNLTAEEGAGCRRAPACDLVCEIPEANPSTDARGHGASVQGDGMFWNMTEVVAAPCTLEQFVLSFMLYISQN